MIIIELILYYINPNMNFRNTIVFQISNGIYTII